MTTSGDPTIDALPGRARNLLAQAFAFYFTAQFATDATSESGVPDLRPALFVNIGYAYEMSLKAVLASKGWDDRRLQREIGHDLGAALREVEAVGYVPTDALRDHIRLLSPPFANHTLRYLSFGTVELPADPLAVLGEHLHAVGNQLLLPSAKAGG